MRSRSIYPSVFYLIAPESAPRNEWFLCKHALRYFPFLAHRYHYRIMSRVVTIISRDGYGAPIRLGRKYSSTYFCSN